MNKSSIKKLMVTSVITTIIAMSNIQLVSAASKYKVNTNCSQNQSNYGIKIIKTYNDNTDCKNAKNNTSNTVNIASQAKPTNSNTVNTTSQSKATTTTTNNSSINALEKEVITLVNAERTKANLPALKANAQLSNVARLKSQDMIDKKYFSHTSPTYGSPFDMMKKFGIKYSTAGENIASGYPTAKAVVDGWMNSPGHRYNILNKSFTEIGVGLAKSSTETYYWTQMFINPSK